jgi:hypothetical protein
MVLKIIKAKESYNINEAINSRMNFRKIYENKVKDKMFAELLQHIEPNEKYELTYSIVGEESFEDSEVMELYGTLLVDHV